VRPELSAPSPEPGHFARRVIATALLAVLVFAALSLGSDVRALGRSLRSFDVSALGLALALVLGNYVLRFWRWQYYLRVLSVPVPTRLSALVFLSGFVMSVTPGKMGEVFKSMLLYEYRGIGIARTASIVVAERLLDLVALVLLVSLGGTAFEHGGAVAFSGAVVVAVIVLGCTVKSVGHFVLDQLARLRVAASIVPKLRETYDALHVLTRPAAFGVGGLYALAGWTLECVATMVLVRGFADVQISFEGATFAYAAGTLAGALAMLPGGLGVAEVGMAGLLRATSTTVTAAVASAATILVRLSTLWFGVALGGLALLVLRMSEQKRAESAAK
jgi:uncharacterized protein (TIRG00374 family)